MKSKLRPKFQGKIDVRVYSSAPVLSVVAFCLLGDEQVASCPVAVTVVMVAACESGSLTHDSIYPVPCQTAISHGRLWERHR